MAHYRPLRRERDLAVIKQCAVCGKDFDTKSHNAKYCSECRTEAYRKNHAERSKRRYEQNPEKYRAINKCWRENNREKARQYYQCWRKAHKGYHSLKSRIWREQNPDKVQEQNEQRRAKRHLERKKARLRAIMQANAAKRQEAQQRHKELYQGMSHWDTELPSTSIC